MPVLSLAVPASASAATLVKSSSTLTYTAAAGETNQVTFTVTGRSRSPGTPSGVPVDDDPITPTGCTPSGGGYSCTGITRVVIDTGDGDDTVDADGISAVAQISGGAGNDTLDAGAGADTLTGGDGDDSLDGGAGNDILDAGAGDDDLNGGTGTDKLIGGAGIDKGFYGAEAATPAPSVTLDGVANDGIPGENDDFGADIEDVTLLGVSGVVPTTSTLIGSAGANVLTTGEGNDAITGGAGNDTLVAGAGDDSIDARDGYADRVDCGPGRTRGQRRRARRHQRLV